MKSINEGQFQIGTLAETLAEETEGALQQGPVRARVFTDLSAQEKERYKADIRATNILLQGIPKDIYTLINHYTDSKDIWDNVTMIPGSLINKGMTENLNYTMNLNTSVKSKEKPFTYTMLVSNASVQQYPTQSSMYPQSSNEQSPADNFQLDSGSSSTENLIESQNKVANVNPGQAKPLKCYNCNRLRHIERECPRPKRLQDSDYFKDKMLLTQAQENGTVLDEEQLLFLAGEHVTNFDDDVNDPPEKDLELNVDHIFEAGQCDAFDSE
ncbi:retrovirus-related pol polyprotein from transposon TNT 1-94 [Tanacetum coccineum]